MWITALFRNNYIHDFPDLAFYAKGGSRYTVAEGNVITNQYPSWPGPAVGFGQETDEQFMHGGHVPDLLHGPPQQHLRQLLRRRGRQL